MEFDGGKGEKSGREKKECANEMCSMMHTLDTIGELGPFPPWATLACMHAIGDEVTNCLAITARHGPNSLWEVKEQMKSAGVHVHGIPSRMKHTVP